MFYNKYFSTGPIMEGTGADGELVVRGEMVLENRQYNFRNIEILEGIY